MSSLKSQTINH